MPTSAFTSSGTTVAVSAALPATFNTAGYAALTFTDLGEVTQLGEIGREYEPVKHQPLADRETYTLKGNFSSPEVTMQMARIPSDAGQAILVAGLDSDARHSFEVTLPDGTILYFTSAIFSYLTNVDTGSSICAAAVKVNPSDIVEDAA